VAKRNILSFMTEHPYPNRVLVIAGPTASGKSTLAIDAAVEFDGVVINGDSMQVYGDLRRLSARPSLEDEARAPHRLFGVLDGTEACSVGRWLELAAAEIAAVRAEGKLPIVVGGTGLYLKALLEGLAPVPDIDSTVRAEAEAMYDRLGGAAFRDALHDLDPEGADRLASGDRQRLTRAWAVAKATGRALGDWQRDAPVGPAVETTFAVVILAPERELLYRAIDERFRAMVADGALDEVRDLVARRLDPGLPLMKAVGVRELAGHLAGDTSLEDAVAAAQRSTRNFAKRQSTWLRHQVPYGEIFHAQYSESIRPKIFSFIRQFLLTDSM
jgi:tRNA dimethylallyltransferase